jgi:MSHA biogenesis protein MshL
MKRIVIFIVLSTGLLVGCQPNPLKPNKGSPAIYDMNASMQRDIRANREIAKESSQGISADLSNSLMPQLSLDQSQAKRPDGQRFNISVNEVPAGSFFMSLVKGTPYNMIVDPKVTGTISLELKNVSVDDVLSAVRDIYGYQFQKTSYAYQVYPRSLETKVFRLDYIDIQRTGHSSTSVSSSDLYATNKTGTTTSNTTNTTSQTPGQTGTDRGQQTSSKVETKTVSDFWKNISETLTAFIGSADGRQIILNPLSGTIIVKAYPDELRQVSHYIDSIQASMDRQVVIEAKFLEVRLNNEFQSGVDWSLFGKRFVQNMSNLIGEDGSVTANALVLDPSGGMANVIRLLATQGNVQVLQSPRISTMNNQKAIFKIGKDEYHITNVSVVSNTNASVLNNQNTQDVTLTPFFSGVALDVTPQIADDGDVMLHIHPLISKVSDVDKKFKINDQDQELPLATSDIRESDTLVRAKNGQIVVIGGLMETRTEETLSGAPFLGKIPFVGALFRGTSQTSVKTELIILLKPTVVGHNTWGDQLQQSSEGMKKLNRGFHFGGYPEVFGNEAEFEYRKQVEEKYSK